MSSLPAPIEYIYREIDDRQVKLDLLQPANYDSVNHQYKTLIFYHGGGLIGGSRKFLANHLDLFLNQNWLVLSVDYHLLPEARVQEIHDDVVALEAWLLQHHQEIGADLNRLAVSGASSGAFVGVKTCNTWTSIHPKAFLSLYGMVNTSDAWYTTPKAPGYIMFGMIPLDSLNGANYEKYLKPGRTPISEDYSPMQDLASRVGMIFWAIREGKYIDMLAQKDSGAVYNPLDSITATFPPTVAVHGEVDTVLPIKDSIVLVDVLKKVGVRAELVRVPGADHGLNPAAKMGTFVQIGVDFLESYV